MKVLMFGWEFPPHISGGLGTACYGLTRGLAENDVEVLFVIPKAFGDETQGKYKLIPAAEIPVPQHSTAYELMRDKMTFFGINSLIVPYLTEEAFREYTGEIEYQRSEKRDSVFGEHYLEFSGRYGKDLMTEVWRYSIVAIAP